MYLSENIKYLRKINNMTQSDLIELIGDYKSSSTIQKWEKGSADPPIDVLCKLADIFSVSVDDLLNIDMSCMSKDIKLLSKFHLSSDEEVLSKIADIFSISVDDLLNIDMSCLSDDIKLLSKFHSSSDEVQSLIKFALHI